MLSDRALAAMPLLTSAIAVLLIAGLLALTGCGESGDATTAEAADEPAAYEIDSAQFIAATNKEAILKEFVAAEPNNCRDVDGDFVLSISAAATEVSVDTPLAEVIERMCGAPE